MTNRTLEYGLRPGTAAFPDRFSNTYGVRRIGSQYRLYTITPCARGYLVSPDHAVCRWFASEFVSDSISAALAEIDRIEALPILARAALSTVRN